MIAHVSFTVTTVTGEVIEVEIDDAVIPDDAAARLGWARDVVDADEGVRRKRRLVDSLTVEITDVHVEASG